MNYIEWKCLVFLCCGCSQPCIPPSTGGQFKQQLPWGVNTPEPYQLLLTCLLLSEEQRWTRRKQKQLKENCWMMDM